MKKALFLLLALLLFATVSLTASATEIVDSGTCGKNLTWTLDSDGTLTISGTGDMQSYSIYFVGNFAPWYDNREHIKKVVIEEGVTSIGMYTFYDCSSLTEIIAADSLLSIADYAIGNCPALTSVDFGANSNLTSIGEYAISECTALTEIRIPGSVTNIGITPFAFCTAMENIVVDESNTVFSSDDGVLYDKNKNILVCYPAGKTNQSFIIPDSVTEIDVGAFGACCVLETVVIPDSIKTIPVAMFSHSFSLKNVVISESVTSIGNAAFFRCSSLEQIAIPADVTSIGIEAFLWCSALTDISVDDNNSVYSSLDGVLYNADKTALLCYPIGKTSQSFVVPDGVTEIDYVAFALCEKIEEIYLPDSIKTIGNSAFEECSSLTDVYYAGSKEDWDAMDIGEQNDSLLNATIHFDYVAPESATTVTDSDSGVQIEYTDEAYPQEITLQIEEVSDGSMYLTQQYGKIKTWNISTLIDGVQVQPAVPVQLRLPLPADYNEDTVAVYHVNLQAGVLEQIQPVTIENGYICFAATSFSPYILVDESSVITTPEPEDPTKPDVPDEPVEPDIPEDPADTCDHLCHKDGILGFFWKIMQFFWKIFGTNPVCECGAAHY